MFAECWNSQSICKIKNIGVDSCPLFQWWWSSASRCSWERHVPPEFVTSWLDACSTSHWYRAFRSVSVLLANNRNVRKPTFFKGEEAALKVKSKGSNVYTLPRAESGVNCLYTWLMPSSTCGRLFSLRVWLWFKADQWTRWKFLFNRSTSLWVYFVKLMKFCTLLNVQSRKSATGFAFAVSQSCLHN